MREVDRIAEQMQRAFEGGAWHGPALGEILDEIDAATASAKPLASAHSIWEIVLHLIGTQELLVARMQGIAKDLSPEEDWPPVTSSTPGAWDDAVGRLRELDLQMRDAVAALSDDALEKPLVAGGSTAYDNIHGYVQHSLYHAGQIAILRKGLAG